MLRHRMFPWRRAALALLPLSSLLIGCHRQNALIRKDGETSLFDGLGTERTVTNGSGAVTASLTLSAFG